MNDGTNAPGRDAGPADPYPLLRSPRGALVDDREALLANVLNDPADDTARLVLADWLEEHGEDPFGRFVRAGLVAARFRSEDLIDAPDYYDALDTISGVVTSGEPGRWLSALGIGLSPFGLSDWAWDNAADRVTVRIGAVTGVFTRGLLSELVLTLADWRTLAPHALAAWPIERATITDVKGLTFEIEPPRADRAGWRLLATLVRRRRDQRSGRRQLLATLFGRTDEPDLLPGLWSAESSLFPDRPALVESASAVTASLLAEVLQASQQKNT